MNSTLKVSNKINNTNILRFNFFDYLLIFLLIVITTNPFWLGDRLIKLCLFLIIFYSSYRVQRYIVLDKKILVIFIIYTLLAVIQGLIWDFSLFTLFSSFVISYLSVYYLYKIYGIYFFTILERVLWFYTFVCLIIFIGHETIPAIGDYLSFGINYLAGFSSDVDYHQRSLLFYTYRPAMSTSFGFIRNCGFAHEPGGFAVFLVLAITINFLKNIPIFSKRNIIYLIALFTTVSTAGYLAFIVLTLLSIKQKRSRTFGLIILPIVLYLAIYFYSTLPFLQEKINIQYDDQMGRSMNRQTTGRFYGAVKSIYVITKYPLYGRGLLSMSKPSSSLDPEYTDYGWLSYIAGLGLLIGSLFMFYFTRGIYRFVRDSGYNDYHFIIIFISIMINLSAQVYITNPTFFIFFFIGFYAANKKNNHLFPLRRSQCPGQNRS